ncbi:MAG TPA: phytanoyl-CoA dioxygenase family protein [Candidatus Nanopelagicales bacterium]|nr:phytanoyl-CoA dioxygenase family protein [Candidatus Nanopelagicales bacterium]
MPNARPSWFTAADCRLADFADLVQEPVRTEDYPHAESVVDGIVVYDSAALRAHLVDAGARRSVLAEFAAVLDSGPGVLLLAGAYEAGVVDAATAVFRSIIQGEKDSGTAAGDHFAAAGVNDRVWNALEKLAIADPGVYVDYYSSDMLALVCEAWLGPRYQVTSQLNQVNPGGQAQSPHRDYHLGFLSQAGAESYPAHVHRLSPGLTLQGAIAHCDMPVESGPTFLVPNSHKYEPGYIAWHLPEFQEFAEQQSVQIPLHKGDALFFNPALFHGAGENRSQDIERLGNLLQISSPFGRAMETVDRRRIIEAIYPLLLERKRAGDSERGLRYVVAASANGYAFPLDLDVHQPTGSEPPMAQLDVVLRALDEEWSLEELSKR